MSDRPDFDLMVLTPSGDPDPALAKALRRGAGAEILTKVGGAVEIGLSA